MGRSNPKIWRGRPKQKRTENTVSVILLSAQDILASEGCHRTMTEEIARYAGVGIGSIYDYFPNKIAMAPRGSIYVIDDGHNCLYIAGIKANPADRFLSIHSVLGQFVQEHIPIN